jgi:6-phosphogluconolactonase (cycloisomerase 2 family)
LAFQGDDTGTLSLLNRQLSFGLLPSSLVLSKARRFLLVANHGDEGPPANTVAKAARGWEMRRVFSTTATASIRLEESGALGDGVSFIAHPSISQEENELKQFYAHPNCTGISPDGKLFVTCDKNCDCFYWFTVDETNGALTPQAAPVIQDVATGPLYFAWHPSQPLLYCLNSRQPSLDSYRFDGVGGMSKVASLEVLDVDMTDRGTSFTQGELVLGADGLHLYSLGSVVRKSGRSAERTGFLNVFSVAADGSLAVEQSLELTATDPRGLALSANGRWLAIASPFDGAVVIVLLGSDGVAVEYARHELPGAYRAVFLGEPLPAPAPEAKPAAEDAPEANAAAEAGDADAASAAGAADAGDTAATAGAGGTAALASAAGVGGAVGVSNAATAPGSQP